MALRDCPRTRPRNASHRQRRGKSITPSMTQKQARNPAARIQGYAGLIREDFF
jgi:hypothetical protein